MMPEHAKIVDDLPGTLGLLQQIYDTAEVRAGGKPWFVLIEKQPLDDESWKKGLIFNTQLEYVCSTFFTMKGKEVRLVDPQQRYAFLGLHNFKKMSRHDRKKAVARKVTELLQTDFSSRAEHELDTEWDGKDFNRADALMDCLFFFFRSWGALLDGNVVDNTTAENTLRTPGPSTGSKKRRTASNGNSTPPTTIAKVKAALQSLLTDLEIEHYDLVRGKRNAADKLLAVHAVHPTAVAPFITMLNKLNHKGTGLNVGLSDRLTPLT
jgi:hypothetical protein